MRANDFRYFDPPFAAMAHRGGSLMADNFARENTLHAFANAVELGYRYLETDVHASADGVLVAFHDEDLSRVSGEEGRISELTWDTIRSALVGGAEPIPTLDEILDAFPDALVNIDIKEENAIVPLADAIAAHDAYDRVCVASFSGRRLKAFRMRMPRPVATGASPSTVGITAFFPGLARFLRDPAPVYQMPLSYETLGREWKLFGHKLLGAVHKLGKRVHIWTIDDAEVMHRLIDDGVDGIVTDRPDTLKTVLQARGMWSG